MKYSIIPLISLMLWVGSSLPGRSRILAAARSEQISPENPETVAQNNPQQGELTKAEILNACIHSRKSGNFAPTIQRCPGESLGI